MKGAQNIHIHTENLSKGFDHMLLLGLPLLQSFSLAILTVNGFSFMVFFIFMMRI